MNYHVWTILFVAADLFVHGSELSEYIQSDVPSNVSRLASLYRSDSAYDPSAWSDISQSIIRFCSLLSVL